jgi:hypothetical protein
VSDTGLKKICDNNNVFDEDEKEVKDVKVHARHKSTSRATVVFRMTQVICHDICQDGISPGTFRLRRKLCFIDNGR